MQFNLENIKLYDFSNSNLVDEDKFILSIKHNKAYEEHSYKRN